MRQLDGGYSVSETDDNVSAINEMLSNNSILKHAGVNGEMYSPTRFEEHDGGHVGGAILSEMAA
jgi:hypothetical protein